MPVLIIICAVIFLGLLVWLVKHANQQAERADYVWIRAAEELDGRYIHRETGFLATRPRQIVVTLEGREVTVDHYTQSSGDTHTVYTRVQCATDAPSDLKLQVYRSGGFSGLARAVGFQDVPVGDPAFDEEYIVKASDPELAPMWINKPLRRAILEADVGYRFKLKKGHVTAERPVLDNDPYSIAAAARATAAFANGKQRLLRAWDRLGRDFGGRASSIQGGWVHVDGEHEGVPFTVEVMDVRDYHYTVIVARTVGTASKLVPFALSKEGGHLFGSTMPKVEPPPFETWGYELFSLEGSKVAKIMGARDVEALARCEAAKLRVDEDRVTIMLYGVVTKKQPLHTAIGLVSALAAGADRGPYR